MGDIDHAAEARRILESVTQWGHGPMGGMIDESEGNAIQLAGAQIHATLAAVEVLHEIAHVLGVVRPVTAQLDPKLIAKAANQGNQELGRR